MQLTFNGSDANKTIDVIPGSFFRSDLSFDAGGTGGVPLIRTNVASCGSCQAIADGVGFSLSEAVSLVSGKGAGSFVISSPASCTDALVDVELDFSAVPVVTISWRGNEVPAV